MSENDHAIIGLVFLFVFIFSLIGIIIFLIQMMNYKDHKKKDKK